MREWTYKVKGYGVTTPIPGHADYRPMLVLRGVVEADTVEQARVSARRHCESVCGVREAIVLDCALKSRTAI